MFITFFHVWKSFPTSLRKVGGSTQCQHALSLFIHALRSSSTKTVERCYMTCFVLKVTLNP